MSKVCLYTNIKIERGLQAVTRCLRRYLEEGRQDESILRLNDFGFNGRHFLQVKGTAMGTRFAPAYAKIYMADWEESVFPKCKNRPSHYWRYLDNIWGVWEGMKEDFVEFMGTLNDHHPSIRVKVEKNKDRINFPENMTINSRKWIRQGFKTLGGWTLRCILKAQTHMPCFTGAVTITHTFLRI